MGPVAIHASYLVNLAGSDPTFVDRSVEVLLSRAELRRPATAPASSTSTVGSHRGTDAAHGHRTPGGRRRPRPRRGRRRSGCRRSSSSRTRPAAATSWAPRSRRWPTILDTIAARGVPARRVSICLDAAHLWGAGYPISDPAEVDRLVDEVDRLIGLDRLAMIHFNDSRAELGSRADRHEHIGAGGIGPAGMGALVNHPRLTRVTYYLETPRMDEGYDAVNAARVRDLIAGPRHSARSPTWPGARRRRDPPAHEPQPGRSTRADRAGRHPGAGRRRPVRRAAGPRDLGRRPGSRHARPAAARARRPDPAARAADLDRGVPPRGALLLPAVAGRVRVGREPDARRRRDRARRVSPRSP